MPQVRVELPPPRIDGLPTTRPAIRTMSVTEKLQKLRLEREAQLDQPFKLSVYQPWIEGRGQVSFREAASVSPGWGAAIQARGDDGRVAVDFWAEPNRKYLMECSIWPDERYPVSLYHWDYPRDTRLLSTTSNR